MLEGQQYVGAVSGGQDGDFYGNLFVSDDLQGIDRLSRVGQAEPVTYETLLAQENVPDSFRKLTLTFKADGHIIKKISFDYGASFTLADYPEIPQKNGYYAESAGQEAEHRFAMGELPDEVLEICQRLAKLTEMLRGLAELFLSEARTLCMNSPIKVLRMCLSASRRMPSASSVWAIHAPQRFISSITSGWSKSTSLKIRKS